MTDGRNPGSITRAVGANRRDPQTSPPPRHWPWRLGTVIVFLITLPFVFVLDTVLQIIADVADVVVLLTTIAISVAVPVGILWLPVASPAWYAVAAPVGSSRRFRWRGGTRGRRTRRKQTRRQI